MPLSVELRAFQSGQEFSTYLVTASKALLARTQAKPDLVILQ